MFRNGLSDSRIAFELGKKGTSSIDEAAQTAMNLANFYRLADKDPRYHTMSYSHGYSQPQRQPDRPTQTTANTPPPPPRLRIMHQTTLHIMHQTTLRLMHQATLRTMLQTTLRLRTMVIKARATRTRTMEDLPMLLMHPHPTTPDASYRIGS